MLTLFFLSYVVDSQILAKSSSGQNCHWGSLLHHKIKGKQMLLELFPVENGQALADSAGYEQT
jgi:hypothetical protein